MLRRLFLAALAGMAVAAEPAAAQTYPNRPIKLVVPLVAGGPPDVVARVIADALSSRLGQNVVVENRPGAGGTIGTQSVATSAADGYTLLFASTTALSIAPALFKTVPYDPIKSFTPVAGTSVGPMVVVVHPSVPAKTVQELVAHAKANPGKLNYGAGVASPPHMAWALFNNVTGTNIVYIPYRGMAPAMTDLIAGQVQMMIDGVGPLLSNIQDGRVRPLAVTGKTRSPDFPDLPTMIEAGYPDYVLAFWTGIVAPAGTPADIVQRLNVAVNDSLQASAVKASLARFNVEAIGGSPQDFAKFIADEADRWGGIIRKNNIKEE
jgi:tripartite-type tricarboxylate transporter receptor subunit TctC